MSMKPAEIKGTELKKAIDNAEKALAEMQKRSDANSVEAGLIALYGSEVGRQNLRRALSSAC